MPLCSSKESYFNAIFAKNNGLCKLYAIFYYSHNHRATCLLIFYHETVGSKQFSGVQLIAYI